MFEGSVATVAHQLILCGKRGVQIWKHAMDSPAPILYIHTGRIRKYKRPARTIQAGRCRFAQCGVRARPWPSSG